MPRWVMPIALALGCSSRPVPVPPANAEPPPAERDPWADVGDQVAAMAHWQRLAPTGTNWYQVVDSLPARAQLPMAYALLRDGNLDCPIDVHCHRAEMRQPGDADTLASPCLRRAIVVRLVDGESRIELPDHVRAAAAGTRDRDLIDRLAPRLADRDLLALLIGFEAAGSDTADLSLLEGRPLAVIAEAADAHVDAAIGPLVEAAERDDGARRQLVAAVADTGLAPGVREIAIANVLPLATGADISTLRTSLRRAAGDASCSLAAHAAHALAELGDRSLLPRRPTSDDPADYFRAACRLAAGDLHDWSHLQRTYVPRGGVRVRMPGGERYSDSTAASEVTLDRDSADVLVLLRELSGPGARCDRERCTVRSARFDLQWTRDRNGGLLLAGVTVHRDRAGERHEQAESDDCDPHHGGD